MLFSSARPLLLASTHAYARSLSVSLLSLLSPFRQGCIFSLSLSLSFLSLLLARSQKQVCHLSLSLFFALCHHTPSGPYHSQAGVRVTSCSFTCRRLAVST